MGGGGGHSKVLGLDSVSQEQVLLSMAKRLKKKERKKHIIRLFLGTGQRV